MTIGQRIKLKREELQMSQEELAKKMGYKTRNAIYQYEQAENMKLSLVSKFAEALGCSPSYLLGWDNDSAVGNNVKVTTAHSDYIFNDTVIESDNLKKIDCTFYIDKGNDQQYENMIKLLTLIDVIKKQNKVADLLKYAQFLIN